MIKRLIPLLLAMLLFTGCGAAEADREPVSRDIFAMDTYMTVTCCGKNADKALDAAEAEIMRLDELLSVGKADSEISRLNETGSITLSEDSRVMVDKSLEIYSGTDGAFDITVYPLMVLWGFTSGDFRVPEAAELGAILEKVGSDRLTYNSDTGVLTLADGQGVDLGGIAKGYTSDRLMEIFREYELDYGVMSLGGNVQFYGRKADGSDWRCGIQDPFDADSGEMMAVLETGDTAVITSGAYERYFTDESGNTYHHIIDPKTGYSANNGLVSVTIVSKSGMLADGLSTACYVMGLDRAVEYWRQSDKDFDMVLMTDSGEIYVTSPIADGLTTDYPVRVISEEGVN